MLRAKLLSALGRVYAVATAPGCAPPWTASASSATRGRALDRPSSARTSASAPSSAGSARRSGRGSPRARRPRACATPRRTRARRTPRRVRGGGAAPAGLRQVQRPRHGPLAFHRERADRARGIRARARALRMGSAGRPRLEEPRSGCVLRHANVESPFGGSAESGRPPRGGDAADGRPDDRRDPRPVRGARRAGRSTRPTA